MKRLALSSLFLLLLIRLGADETKLRSFDDLTKALWYYDQANSCQEIQNASITRSELKKAYSDSKARILSGVRSKYSQSDYSAVETFFDDRLVKWNKKSRLLLYPCHADKAIIRGKTSWVLAFDWEIPGVSSENGKEILSHIMLFIVDPANGNILDTVSCG